MCEKHLGQCFILMALHRLPSHSSVFWHSVFQALFFFSMTVFKREIISPSVLTLLKTLVIVCLCNISNAVSILAVVQASNFLLYPAAWIQI